MFGGYNPNDVDDFLDTVADRFEEIYTENLRMQEEISSVRERLSQFEELEGSIRSALVQAEKAAGDLRRSASQEADNVRMNANREAELTIREAKTRSRQILSDSSARAERTRESYEALKEARSRFADDFRKLLKSYLEVMDNAEVVSAREIEASLRDRLDLESMSVAREAAEDEEAGEATQQFQWWSDDESSGETSPETEEPEVEPSSAEHEPEQPDATAENEAEEEVEREEHAPTETGEPERDEPENASESSPDEDAPSDESERASRFLRRRE